VAQGVGLEFKLQYLTHKKKNKGQDSDPSEGTWFHLGY
jgi:hypothetical protein